MRMAAARILFVEDEASISDPFSRALTREGFEPIVARTAREALALAERMPPDLVLLDLNLPDGDGRDVARRPRRPAHMASLNPPPPRPQADMPIVMLAARGTETDKIVGLELGADDYVVKPFSGAELIARIRAVLRRAAPARAAEEQAPEAPVTIDALHVDLAARRATLAGEELSLSR